MHNAASRQVNRWSLVGDLLARHSGYNPTSLGSAEKAGRCKHDSIGRDWQP